MDNYEDTGFSGGCQGKNKKKGKKAGNQLASSS
jgi:hypothetical protein